MNEPTTKAIRYTRHFTALIAAVVVFWLTKDTRFVIRISNFNLFHFGLIGFLHPTAIVVSLHNRRAHAIMAIPFVLMAAAWSAATPILALFSVTLLLAPFPERIVTELFSFIVLLLCGSAMGASGYWLLVRLFWVKSLRGSDCLKTVALCAAATLMAVVILEVADPSADSITVPLTIPWWFAFSISLYWSEAVRPSEQCSQTMENSV